MSSSMLVAESALPRLGGVRLPAESRPHLFVIVDTEEEFDWFGGFRRENTSVTAMRQIDRAQAIWDRFGIRPTYVIDYPVAAQPAGYEPLQQIAFEGRCAVGAHLHPWVNPPYQEELTGRNSFTMNLPPELQQSKLAALSEVITARFDRPRVFKAGRYGLGPVTVDLLDRLGFEVDNSVCPTMDFTPEGGPAFVHADCMPFFLTPNLLELPCTIAYVGWAGRLKATLHEAASRAPEPMRAVGALARAGVVNRIMLSPEGNTFAEMRRLTEFLLRRGCRTFTLSYHSPSVVPGHTPYVRSDADLQRFLRCIELYCEFFFGALGGAAGAPLEFRAQVSPSKGSV